MKPASSLQRFTVYADRADYQNKTGKVAPAFRADLPPKFWEDPGPDVNSPVQTYFRLPYPGEPIMFVSFSVPTDQASTVNLPGRVFYPPYRPAPVAAMWGPSPAGNPNEFASLSDALALMAELGGSNLRQENNSVGGEGITYAQTEPRRRWAFDVGGAPQIVGTLLQQKYVMGVGAPGSWTVQGGTVTWTPNQSVGDANTWTNNLAPVPVPVHQVGPGETLVRAGLDNGLYIQSATDAVSAPGQLPPHFEADFAQLKADVAAIKAGLKTLGIGA